MHHLGAIEVLTSYSSLDYITGGSKEVVTATGVRNENDQFVRWTLLCI